MRFGLVVVPLLGNPEPSLQIVIDVDRVGDQPGGFFSTQRPDTSCLGGSIMGPGNGTNFS